MKISDYNEQPEWNNSSKQYENKLEKQLIEDILFISNLNSIQDLNI